MQLVVELDAVEVCAVSIDFPSLILGVLFDLLQPNLLLLHRVVSILDPLKGDEG